MYLLTYSALIIYLHLSVLEAKTCDKTQLSLQKSSSSSSSSSSPPSSSSTPPTTTRSTSREPETSAVVPTDKHAKSSNETVRLESDLLSFHTNSDRSDNDSNRQEYADLVTGSDTALNQQHDLENLNLLRVEYNKYKILSNLGLNIDPHKLEPNLDDDIRYKLTTSKMISESQIERNTNVSSFLSSLSDFYPTN